MRLLERVILKCEGSVVLKAIESTECVGDSEKARLGNTTFLELTFPNSGCRSAATLRKRFFTLISRFIYSKSTQFTS